LVRNLLESVGIDLSPSAMYILWRVV